MMGGLDHEIEVPDYPVILSLFLGLHFIRFLTGANPEASSATAIKFHYNG